MRLTDGARKQQAAAGTWLHYFNDYLFSQGLITKRERNRMNVKIATAHPVEGANGLVRTENQEMA